MSKAYVLKVKPELSKQDAKQAEQDLTTRFQRVSDRYGKDMREQNRKTADNLSKVMNTTLANIKAKWILIAKAVSWLSQTTVDTATAKLDEYLQRLDNIATRAQQWGVDPTKYMLASEVAQIAGVNAQMFDNAILRIADRIESARTGEDDYLKEFTDAGDVVDAAFQLFGTWAKMAPEARAASMGEVLGTRQAGAFAELVDTDWLDETRRLLQGRNYTELRAMIERGGDLERQQARQRSQLRIREIYDMNTAITGETLPAQNRLEAARQEKQISAVKRLPDEVSTEIALMKGTEVLQDIRSQVTKLVGMIADELGINGKEAQAAANAKWKADVVDPLVSDVPNFKSTHGLLTPRPIKMGLK